METIQTETLDREKLEALRQKSAKIRKLLFLESLILGVLALIMHFAKADVQNTLPFLDDETLWSLKIAFIAIAIIQPIALTLGFLKVKERV